MLIILNATFFDLEWIQSMDDEEYFWFSFALVYSLLMISLSFAVMWFAENWSYLKENISFGKLLKSSYKTLACWILTATYKNFEYHFLSLLYMFLEIYEPIDSKPPVEESHMTSTKSSNEMLIVMT